MFVLPILFFCGKLEFHHLVAGFQGVQARKFDSSDLLCDTDMCAGNGICLSAKLFHFYHNYNGQIRTQRNVTFETELFGCRITKTV
jgi:hypothetical protein